MYSKIVKNSVSNYPSPTLNCCVNCFLNEADMDDSNKAVYWIPFQIDLVQNKDKTKEEIEALIEITGTEKFNAPEMQHIYEAIELGASLGI